MLGLKGRQDGRGLLVHLHIDFVDTVDAGLVSVEDVDAETHRGLAVGGNEKQAGTEVGCRFRQRIQHLADFGPRRPESLPRQSIEQGLRCRRARGRARANTIKRAEVRTQQEFLIDLGREMVEDCGRGCDVVVA